MHASRPPIDRHNPLYPRLRAALFLAGFATFALLYCVQPLLTVFHAEFGVSAATASLALSLSTGCLAFSILGTTPLAVRFGRRRVMSASMLLAALCNIAVAVSPSLGTLLVLRAIEGVLLGGVPAVAMAHLADEIAPADLARTMGLYIAGTAVGGFSGRVGIALVSEWGGWRAGMAVTGSVCLLAALLFVWLLPPARIDHRAQAARAQEAGTGSGWVWHLRDGGMIGLFLVGFLAMSCFVTAYNYLGFRLLRPPFSLGQAASGAVFAVYPLGILASPIAGRLSGRFGPGPVLLSGPCLGLVGLALALLPSLPAVMGGLGLITIGFFVSHAVASASVGQRATRDRGHAAALYLLFYYVGSSIMGTLGGWFWSHGAWLGVTGYCAVLLMVAAATSGLLMLRPATRSTVAPGA